MPNCQFCEFAAFVSNLHLMVAYRSLRRSNGNGIDCNALAILLYRLHAAVVIALEGIPIDLSGEEGHDDDLEIEKE